MRKEEERKEKREQEETSTTDSKKHGISKNSIIFLNHFEDLFILFIVLVAFTCDQSLLQQLLQE